MPDRTELPLGALDERDVSFLRSIAEETAHGEALRPKADTARLHALANEIEALLEAVKQPKDTATVLEKAGAISNDELRNRLARRLHELQCDRAHCDKHCEDDFEYEAADEILAMVAEQAQDDMEQKHLRRLYDWVIGLPDEAFSGLGAAIRTQAVIEMDRE